VKYQARVPEVQLMGGLELVLKWSEQVSSITETHSSSGRGRAGEGGEAKCKVKTKKP